ncbi:hypothetical protein ABZX85_44555 [Streptomyces sp. NPDC004539]|uniref:WD40 repeat domain-containing protein n=1 Tax=Streptomyces sp. NPDC004539 TaxID=3154280 RepID=UPI0033AB3257
MSVLGWTPVHVPFPGLPLDRVQPPAGPHSTGAVVSLAAGPGGRTLYVGRPPAIGTVVDEAWDTTAGRRTTVLAGLTSIHLAARPDGRLLIGDNRIARLPSGTVTGQGLQNEQVGALAFSSDGSRLAVGDRTGRVALWDGTVRHRTGVLRNVFPSPLGDDHPEAVSALAISPNNSTLAVGGDTGTLQLWDIATQQPLGGPITIPGEGIQTLAFSRDSGTLYAGSPHVPLQHYTIATDKAVTQVCARAHGDLTRTKWNVLGPDETYRKVCSWKSRET